MNLEFEHIAPRDIEATSMKIIGEELKAKGITLNPEYESVIKRCIHTSADFEYAESLAFSEHAVRSFQEALRSGADIVTDTQMAYSGVSKRTLAKYGGEAFCFMSDPDVAAEAKERGVTRASVSMEKAAKKFGRSGKEVIFAIGNAPTALITLHELMDEHSEFRPAGIIGVPVGFVNVVSSKELIIEGCEMYGVPYIVARGRKGGSNIAAAICNALLYTM